MIAAGGSTDMVASPMPTTGYSAVVRMELIANGRSYPVAKAGPTQLTLVEPADIPTGPARFVTTVDGCPIAWMVNLTNGAVPFDRAVAITIVSADGPFHAPASSAALARSPA